MEPWGKQCVFFTFWTAGKVSVLSLAAACGLHIQKVLKKIGFPLFFLLSRLVFLSLSLGRPLPTQKEAQCRFWVSCFYPSIPSPKKG